MPVVLSIIAVAAIAFLVFRLRQGVGLLKRAQFIRTYTFPKGLFDKLIARHPGMEPRHASLVLRGLRQYFLGYLNAQGKYVSMPSQAADDLWHEFILYTRDYSAFCDKAFGGYMHHTPAAVLGPDKQTNEGLRRSWWWACQDEHQRCKTCAAAAAVRARLKTGDRERVRLPTGLQCTETQWQRHLVLRGRLLVLEH